MKQKTNRILALVSIMLMMCVGIVGLTSCNKDSAKETDTTTDSSVTTDAPAASDPAETTNPANPAETTGSAETAEPEETTKPADPVDPDEVKVSFMVQNDQGEWSVLKDVVVEDGKVVAPKAPEKKYYVFTGWFKDADCTESFSETGIKKSVKAYARYAPDEVTVIINGKDEGTKNLIDVVNSQYNPGEGLEFDGWYKDATCSVKWDGKEVVKNLYAKSVAKIVIDNGYEELYVAKVNPGEMFTNPSKQTVTVEGVDVSLEQSMLKPYMSPYDIDYVDENGELVDFSQPITKSRKITVLWNSKGLSGFKELPKSRDGHFYMSITQFVEEVKNAPVVSIRNKVTVEVTEGDKVTTKTYTVDYLQFYGACLPDTAKKIIIGEGIKAIQHLNGVGASSAEEIVLPSTLKILDNSFNNMPKLKGVTLPDGLEVLIGSFFVDRYAQTVVGHALGFTNNNYEIVVPDSVKNIAMMPNNLKFSKTEATAEIGDFYKGDDGCVYLNHKDGKVLVVDPAAVTGTYKIAAAGIILPKAGTIVVPEGVVGIQVGTYITCFDYLILPSTFKFVNYNANLADYAEFYDIFNSVRTNDDGTTQLMSNGGNVLFDESQFNQYFHPETPQWGNDSNLELEGVAITTNIGGYSYYGVIHCGAGILVMPTAKADRPAGIDLGFLQGGYYSNALPLLDDYVNYKDDKNSVFVTCPFENPQNFFPGNVLVRLEELKTIKVSEIKEALIAKNQALLDLIKDCESFDIYANGVKLENGATVTEDMYLTAVIVEKAKLKVSANYRDSYIMNWDTWEADFSQPEAEGQEFEDGNVVYATTDITGLTADSLKNKIADMGADLAKEGYYGSTSTQDKSVFVANILYHLNHAASVKYMANGEEITDLSRINLDNGSVTLEIVFEFAQ